ncbi:MAG: Uma2 family endonuclease, partial [Pyrinomonadaceae bacterium]
MITKVQATIEDLYRIPENRKAEIVDGDIVLMSPTGDMPGRAGGAIYISLRGIEQQVGGRAYPDNVGFKINLPNRKSLSPDVAFYIGKSSGMKFLEGAPAFAVEIRSENDYGDAAEVEIALKRKDYFAAGTLVVWDVDLLSNDVVKVYRSSDPYNP